MKFIVGIGNPGKKYEGTRHNIGFGVLDAVSARKNLDRKMLLKPDTYVNATGCAVSEVIRKHRLTPSDVLVVCDDVNLQFGKLRLRPSGSAGGHHGLESVIAELGSEEFPRLRIGVGGEHMPKDDLTEFVLGRFTDAEKKALPALLEKTAAVCETWAKDGFDGATNCLSRLQSIQS